MNNEIKYVDLNSLKLYDNKIKNHISTEDQKIEQKYGEALTIEELDDICK